MRIGLVGALSKSLAETLERTRNEWLMGFALARLRGIVRGWGRESRGMRKGAQREGMKIMRGECGR